MCNCKNCGAPLSKNRCLYCGTEYPPRELIYRAPVHTSRTSTRGESVIDNPLSSAGPLGNSVLRGSVICDISYANIEEAHISSAKIRNILDDVRNVIEK